LDLAVEIQQIPAPTFDEGQRAEFVRQRFQFEGLSEVSIDPVGNVFGCLPGKGSKLPLVVSAHLDTVFPQGTSLQVNRQGERISGPGIGDNSLGVAGLFGLVWELGARRVESETRASRLPGDVWLVANVGEEGLGDLRGMQAVADRFGGGVQAYLILEGMALGQIYHRGLGVQRYRITFQTMGGHSWVDYGQPSAVHELAGLINRLTAIPLPERPRTSLNVGTITGGTSVNTIAAQAELLLDLRSEEPQSLAALAAEVEALVSGTNRTGVRCEAQVVGRRPAGQIAADHPLVRLAARCLQELGIQPRLNIGSTDANVPLSRGYPAICLGLTSGAGAHTTEEYIFTSPLAKGMAQLVSVVQGVWELKPANTRRTRAGAGA